MLSPIDVVLWALAAVILIVALAAMVVLIALIRIVVRNAAKARDDQRRDDQ